MRQRKQNGRRRPSAPQARTEAAQNERVNLRLGVAPGQVQVAFDRQTQNIILTSEDAAALGSKLIEASQRSALLRHERLAQLAKELGPDVMAEMVERTKTREPS